MAILKEDAFIGLAGLRQLRHDLLNSLNILGGATAVMLETELTDIQRSCLKACRSAAERLLEVANHLEDYQRQPSIDGPAQLADLCSIAAARLDKPFEREGLLEVIRQLAPMPTPRILLVDDAPDIEVLVRAYLKDTPTALDSVADGQRAVAQAMSQSYDLVLMDVDLPGLDGATAAHAIRTADLARGVKPTPIVAMSAMASRMPDPVDEADEDVVVLEDPETAPLVPGFLDHRREDVVAARSLLEQGEFGRLQAIGHKMKGTGRGYGFKAITRIGAALELAAHQLDAQAVERLVNELDSYLSRVKTITRT